MQFTEEKLEQAFIELLGTEKIPFLPGHEINNTSDEILIKEDMKTYLHPMDQVMPLVALSGI